MRPFTLLSALVASLASASAVYGSTTRRGGPRVRLRDPRVEGMAQAKREIRQRRNLWLVERGGLKAI